MVLRISAAFMPTSGPIARIARTPAASTSRWSGSRRRRAGLQRAFEILAERFAHGIGLAADGHARVDRPAAPWRRGTSRYRSKNASGDGHTVSGSHPLRYSRERYWLASDTLVMAARVGVVDQALARAERDRVEVDGLGDRAGIEEIARRMARRCRGRIDPVRGVRAKSGGGSSRCRRWRGGGV